ncbi:hypothetical protein J3R30DRAFT_3478351 [Lentinula aciculospora]|uniref:GST N-terminal domain-containing protein n=1 Tax=Lentinula aciculospora TaxID=153920 RepID=A0A9W9AB94_9AGAR|nr:hypothetical protein J3R30DRAFT_3478351 [Lentinula aciculospora]
MSPYPEVILYRYDASPFSVKIDNVLLLKNIPHSTVKVANMLPRPEITDFLGLTYRRIPILAIGNDIYCDTSLIVAALERRFPTSYGFGTIFPPKKHGGSRDTGLLKAFTQHYADTVLFNLGPVLLPWNRFPESFLKDRRTLAPNFNVQVMMDSQGKVMNALSAHLALVEDQLQDGREWLFDTELPSLADIGIHFTYNWLRGFPNTKSLFDERNNPYALKWLDRLNKFIETTRKDFPSRIALTGPDAANLIANSPYEPYDVVGFNAPEAARVNIVEGQMVNVVPDDTGTQFATTGKLVGFNHEEIVIETKGTMSNAIFRCHFPRIGFTLKGVQQPKL